MDPTSLQSLVESVVADVEAVNAARDKKGTESRAAKHGRSGHDISGFNRMELRGDT
jgi:hypothetical protein